VPSGKISFPCFEDQAFYFYVQEYDEVNDDKAVQVSVGCEDLQIGENEIQIHLAENSELLSNVYDAVQGSAVTEFRFFDDALVNQAIYQITLEVSDKCEDGPLLDESIEGPSGLLEVRSIDTEELKEKIQQIEFVSKPGIILGNGTVRNQSRIQITQFVTDGDFSSEL